MDIQSVWEIQGYSQKIESRFWAQGLADPSSYLGTRELRDVKKITTIKYLDIVFRKNMGSGQYSNDHGSISSTIRIFDDLGV